MPETTDFSNSYYYELAARWANGTITAAERQELEQWYSQGQDADVYIPAGLAVSEEAHEAQLLLKIQQKIAAETTTTPVFTVSLPRTAAGGPPLPLYCYYPRVAIYGKRRFAGRL